MDWPSNMIKYTQLQQQHRLYHFLQAVGDEFDTEKRDLLKQDPLPTVEEAYSQIRREVARRSIMKGEGGPSSGDLPSGIGSGLAVARGSPRVQSKSNEGALLRS